MLRNFESALLRYCSLKLDKGLFSLSKKDGLDKWSWHLDVRISQKFCQKRCNFLWKWSQKIKLLEWCSFKLLCSTSSHHFNFVWMYVFNAFSPHYNKKNRKTSTNTNLNLDAKKSRFIFTSTSSASSNILTSASWRNKLTSKCDVNYMVTIMAFLSTFFWIKAKLVSFKICQNNPTFFSHF